MDDFKPNIKVELVSLWSDAAAGPIKVIRLIVSRKFQEKSEVHFFDLETLMRNAELDINPAETDFERLFQKLTNREREILILVAKGTTSVEIPEEFYISINTVKNHRRNIKRKLNPATPIEYSKFLRWVFLNY